MSMRKKYWIVPDFQSRMIKQWIFLVLMTNIATNLITIAFVHYQDQRTKGEYFYVPEKVGSSPVIVDPVIVKRKDIVIPSLIIALTLGIGLSILAGIFYSHRLAGPLYRIRRTLSELQEGRQAALILLRKNDEFKGLAEDLNRLLVGKTSSS